MPRNGTPPLAAGILEDPGAYISAVDAYRDGDINARKDAADWRILDILIRQPVVDAERISGELDISLVNARRALDRLEEDGVMFSAQITKGRRAWRGLEVIDLLDEFSERARRRGTP